jgi:hypothetical protein
LSNRRAKSTRVTRGRLDQGGDHRHGIPSAQWTANETETAFGGHRHG